jgi:hypothetical protein
LATIIPYNPDIEWFDFSNGSFVIYNGAPYEHLRVSLAANDSAVVVMSLGNNNTSPWVDVISSSRELNQCFKLQPPMYFSLPDGTDKEITAYSFGGSDGYLPPTPTPPSNTTSDDDESGVCPFDASLCHVNSEAECCSMGDIQVCSTMNGDSCTNCDCVSSAWALRRSYLHRLLLPLLFAVWSYN